MMAQEKPGHTLHPTALVHEAYLRLVRLAGLVPKNRRGVGTAIHVAAPIQDKDLRL
jgi:hypothetical protein